MNIKNAPLKVKATGEDAGLEEGQFEAYAAVFDVKDSHGDIIRKGAFADTLKAWDESEAHIPVLWSHDFDDAFNNIGRVLKAEEDDDGLKVVAELDLENPNGKQVHRLITQKRVTDLSFAFDVDDYQVHNAKGDDEGYTELLKLGLFEISVVTVGANRSTRFTDVKESAVKTSARKLASAAGRVGAAKDATELASAFRSLAEHIEKLSEQVGAHAPAEDEDHDDTAHAEQEHVESEDREDGKDQGDEPAKASAEYMARKLRFYALRGKKGDS